MISAATPVVILLAVIIPAAAAVPARAVVGSDVRAGITAPAEGGRLKGFDLQWTQDTHRCLGERIPA